VIILIFLNFCQVVNATINIYRIFPLYGMVKILCRRTCAAIQFCNPFPCFFLYLYIYVFIILIIIIMIVIIIIIVIIILTYLIVDCCFYILLAY